jgi:hypothetical protein
LGYPFRCRPRGRHTAGCPSGQRERSVKPSAQPTLVRTQHLPHPGETARWLRKRSPAGRFLLLTPCIRVRHYGSMHGSVRVHMVYSVRAKLAVRITAPSAYRGPPLDIRAWPAGHRRASGLRRDYADRWPGDCWRRLSAQLRSAGTARFGVPGVFLQYTFYVPISFLHRKAFRWGAGCWPRLRLVRVYGDQPGGEPRCRPVLQVQPSSGAQRKPSPARPAGFQDRPTGHRRQFPGWRHSNEPA